MTLGGAVPAAETYTGVRPPGGRRDPGAAGTDVHPYTRSLAQLFAAQVLRHPQRCAVSGPEARYTYAELDALAGRFARGLRRFGVGAGAVVGIMGRRGEASCAAIVGAAYAGVTYLPLDASLPAGRMRGMLEDAGASVVVRLPGTDRDGGGEPVPVLDFDEVLNVGGDVSATDDGRVPAGADGVAASVPAYVMFTSGTTGRPKAVAVPQRGVARLALGNGFMDIRPEDRVMHAAALSFDASVLEMWPALLNGACLVPVPSHVLLAPTELHRFVVHEGITVLFLTTSVFHLMARERPETFAGLRYVVTGGEALRPDAARRVLERGRPQHLVNAYGPTEAACVVLAHEITHVPVDAPSVPVGRPIADTVCHILREDGSPAGPGEVGELYVGGGGIARGYLNDPDDSARRFLTLGPASTGQPFVGPGHHPARTGRAAPEPQRVYRSGDFVRRRDDGVIEFCGRRDDQVKVRGFRIEPEEVRTALTRVPGVADAVVVAREDGTSRCLHAYVTGRRADRAPSVPEVRARLGELLPPFMVPATITVLDALPLAASGKVDRAALPEPATDGGEGGGEGEDGHRGGSAPEAGGGDGERVLDRAGSVAAAVAGAWASILPVGRAEPDDDFFACGGSSLLAVRLVARVQQTLALDQRHSYRLVTSLLNEPTVKAFTAAVEEAVSEDVVDVDVDPRVAPDADVTTGEAVLGAAGATDVTGLTGTSGIPGALGAQALGRPVPHAARAAAAPDRVVPDRARRDGAPRPAAAAHADRWRPDLRWDVPPVGGSGPRPDWRAPRRVFLTGATGFVGAYLLRELLDRTDADVHALVRARDAAHAMDRLARAQTRYGIRRPLPPHRVRPLLGDLTRPRLGLTGQDWEDEAAGADVIHHCGAEVNFLYPYEKLRAANVYGTREVVALAARRAIPLHHVSTVAVVHGMGAAGVRDVTEETPLDHVELLSMGYTESKWVAEELVRCAARAGLPVAVHRPYEVSGDTSGHVWNSGAALCELFRFITELGLAPDLALPLNLVPADFVAGAVVHLATHREAAGQTYHVTNPRPAMLDAMVDRLRAHGHPIRTVGLGAWVDAMAAHLARRPSHPFGPFAALFTTDDAAGGGTVQELSSAGRAPRLDRSRLEADLAGSGLVCPPVDAQLLDHYVRYFHSSGFIPAP
ncbi:amino acid adenylation domain-containing protein [Streptomyces sp. WAC05374]|uniref:amino acid adenylation domain-containing protein n=3 Tax=Streptomyces sp. WAC05374 TaxID=2487420 RepID=UPI0013594742|nr:amino acid adenylation domain-containing protein [Streptomyces sp. WAC05374]